ncbi:hypothetical protein HOD05_04045 [Candidatus Woesearchaeota archaeon]|jgi:hypothetical protein|nr:hypothetical protein [Candidatus Woesearchaeota archaeon]MBT4151209.1 hypothetical protein [Candidatus Woesearchaeota archaeon]MBT4247297.1 hypothetical protein [Candidatus Woesearchaeota archaeon]MBT4434366.1 hypothetical protein [Candidatus Woesearchaeota archaeon]MBT7331729.1 hypothetical protein [Candidatus Woesearchaeota archaeon]
MTLDGRPAPHSYMGQDADMRYERMENARRERETEGTTMFYCNKPYSLGKFFDNVKTMGIKDALIHDYLVTLLKWEGILTGTRLPSTPHSPLEITLKKD